MFGPLRPPRFVRLLVIISLVAAGLAQNGRSWSIQAQPRWHDERELSRFGWTSTASSLLAAGPTVHYAWWDGQIWYRRSPDSGRTWESPVRLTAGKGKSQMPALARAGSAVVLTWMDDSDGGTEIYVRRSIDGGTTWGPVVRLTANRKVFRYYVATSGSLVHVAWTDRLTGCPPRGVPCNAGNLYYRRSTDGGITWEPAIQFTTGATAARAVVAAFGSYVHIVWGDVRDGNPEIYYKRSGDGGTTWQPDRRVTRNAWWSGRPVIAATRSGTVVIVWDDGYVWKGAAWDDAIEELYITRSTDHGQTWTPPTALTAAPRTQTHANLTAGISGLHLTWTDNRDGSWKPYYKTSPDGGATWGPDELLSPAGDTWAGMAIETSSGVLATYGRKDRIYYRMRRP